MIRKKTVWGALVVCFILLGFAKYDSSQIQGEEILGDLPEPNPAVGQVTITGNAQLDAYMVGKGTGAGTEGDPYILEGFDFASTVYCFRLIDVNNRHLVLRGCSFTALDSSIVSLYGVYIEDSGNITIEDCTFSNWYCPSVMGFLYGIYLDGGANNTVKNCLFSDLTAFRVYGIYNSYCHGSLIEGNNFTDLHSTAALLGGILSGANWNTIQNNYFGRNYSSPSDVTCIALYSTAAGNLITNNTVEDVQAGDSFRALLIDGSGNLVLQNNFFSGTSANGYESYGIYSFSSSTGNIFSGNFIGAGALPTREEGTGNKWYRYDYFSPMGRYQNVGNYYWNYTGSDANGDYVGDTSYAIYTTSDPAPIMYSGMDNDHDDLTNHDEMAAGTDVNNPDTDGDGWTDFQEVKVYGTNPLAQDTDGDGKIDPLDETPDYKDPIVPTVNTTVDTDGDGLTDYEETNDYKTNPTMNDTDGDGWTDYDELKKYGTNPLSQDSDGDGLIDSVDPHPNTPEVTTTLPVDYTKTIYYVTGGLCLSILVLAISLFVHSRGQKKSSTKAEIPEKQDKTAKPAQIPSSRKK